MNVKQIITNKKGTKNTYGTIKAETTLATMISKTWSEYKIPIS